MRRMWQNFLRKHIRPISQEYALVSKRNLSIAYAFFAWNAAAFLVVSLMRQSFPMTEEEKKKPTDYYRRLYQAEGATVMHIDGLTVTETVHHKGVPALEVPEVSNQDPELLKQ